MNIEWVKLPDNHDVLFLGKWRVGGVYYSGMVSKGDLNKYKAYCTLPGIKEVIGHYATVEEAKSRLERAVKHWIKGTEES